MRATYDWQSLPKDEIWLCMVRVWSISPWNPPIKTVQKHQVLRLELKGSCYKMNGGMGAVQARRGLTAACRERDQGSARPRTALHLLPRRRLLPCTLPPCSTTVRLRALIPLFPRVMTMSLSRPAHSPISILWTGRARQDGEGAHDQQFRVGCRGGHACGPEPPEGSLSSLVLVRPPRCDLRHFFSTEFIFLSFIVAASIISKALYSG